MAILMLVFPLYESMGFAASEKRPLWGRGPPVLISYLLCINLCACHYTSLF